MNKVIKLSAMVGACAFLALVPASNAYADELILSDGYDSCMESSNDFMSTDVLVLDNNSFGINDGLIIDEPTFTRDVNLCDNLNPSGDWQLNDIVICDELRGSAPGRLDDEIRILGDVMDTPTLDTTQTMNRPTKKERMTEKANRPVKTVTSTNPGTTTTNNSASDTETALNLVNARRASSGVGKLRLNSDLSRAAQARAEEITRKFSHIRPDGRTNVSILGDYGIDYNRAGENIACSTDNASDVVSAWASSPTHNKCMLNSVYTQAGIGTATVGGSTYWVLLLTD